jgi:hypothetical protein
MCLGSLLTHPRKQTQFDVDVCLNWSNINWNSSTKRLSGCADIAAVVTSITIFDLKLGCFDLHA